MHTPRIFVSATSGDLRSARSIARDALLTINCHPVEQTNFEPDYRTVAEMLRGKIQQCQALIHIVGYRYGAEPDPASLPAGTPRRSYTQMEYHIARELGLRVYTFLLPEDYPYDEPPHEEDAELTALQNEHRAHLRADPHLRESPRDQVELRTRIIALQEKVVALEQEQQAIHKEVKTSRRWGLWVAAAIFLLLGAIGWGVHYITTQNQGITSEVKEIKVVFAKERSFMARILARANDRIKDWENMKPAERFDLALDEIAREDKIPADELRALLDLYVERVEIDPDAEAEDKYYVLMRKQLFGDAAKLASSEAETAEARMKQQASRRAAAQAVLEKAAEEEQLERQRAIDFFQKEGAAHFSAVKYEAALSAYQKAAALVDKAADPLGWCDVSNKVAFMMYKLARLKEAVPMMREILHIRRAYLDHHNPELAVSFNNLASILVDSGCYEEAESHYYSALQIDEAHFGPNDPKVAHRLVNIAWLLKHTNRIQDAEDSFRRALEIIESSQGENDADVSIALNGLAQLLHDTGRIPEAEQLYQRALTISESCFGPNHPSVATDLNNLGRVLHDKGRLAEAEPLLRRALRVCETVYGPDHTEVALGLNNLGQLLHDSGRLNEAEPVLRRSLEIYEDHFGSNDFRLAVPLNNLSGLLRSLDRFSEAEPLAHRMVAILVASRRSSGIEHPRFKAIVGNYHDLLLGMKLPKDQIEAKLRDVLGPDLAPTILGPFQVTITEVVKDGQGEALGLRVGDIFVRYNEQPITSTAQLIRLTGESTGDAIPVEMRRGEQTLKLTAKAGRFGIAIENRPLAPAATKP